MTKIIAQDLSDYHDQSLYEPENAQFVEDVESTILEHFPSKGTVEIDYETTYLSYRKEGDSITIERLFTWSGELEHSDLKLYGKIKVRAKYTPQGSEPAILELVHAWDYEDDLSK
ncbi:MAG: hypothetical protein IT174_17500 [Acidobacteria bacterium]|nr:hypothetical protein [Acidobacteriota bacterium]